MENNQLGTNQTKKKSKVIYYIIAIVFFIAVSISTWQLYQKKNIDDKYVEIDDQTAIYPDTENYDYYNKVLFDINEYDIISQEYREGIMKVLRDNGWLNPAEGEKRFSLTKIRDRASKIFAFGNFTGQTKNNKPELAFLIQSEDANDSKLFIISSDRDVLFRKDYSSAPIINSFKKGAKIFMDSDMLQSSLKDGLIIKFKDSKYALVYNGSSKSFDEFYQYTNNDIIHNKREKEIADDNEEQAQLEEENASNSDETLNDK